MVQILDHGVDESTKTPFIAMELLEGESLAERLARTGRLTTTETLQVATHVARALTRAHELAIVHRDLKPGNIFLVANEDEATVKVLDFGLAKWNEASRSAGVATVTGTFVGTAYYMSPEQVAGKKADPLSDLWALGVVVYECVTGQRPFEADNVVALAMQISRARFTRSSSLAPVSEEFDFWFERALAANPAARFQSAREMVEQLRRVEAKGPTARSPLEPPAPSPPALPPIASPLHAPNPLEQTVGCFDADANVIPSVDGVRLALEVEA